MLRTGAAVFDRDLFRRDPRSYALAPVDDGLVDARDMLLAVLVYLSHDDVRGALDANEMSPRFDPDGEDDAED